MLESFYSARQQFREEEAREAAFAARNSAVAATHAHEEEAQAVIDLANAADRPLDPVLEEIAMGCDSYNALKARLDHVFEW
jgi:hypothetical protein